MLLQHPNLGRPGRRRGTRELVIGRTPFIVVYRVDMQAGKIEIIQFRHSAQKQWDGLLLTNKRLGA
jgi:toxin ParE1/3/4